jgi:hypothetical protein
MAFADWNSYTGLLDNLAEAESNWSDATDFAEFDAKVRQNCSGLVPNSGGYDELVTHLDESGDYGDADKLFEHLRIVIFAEAADVAELGADWAGYWISKDGDDAQIYAESRGAAVSAWTAMDDTAATEETADVEETEPAAANTDVADPQQQQQFDEESGRWRRWSDDDDAYEYFHQDDGVWERVAGDLWSRYHDGARRWLPYNGPSETWLHENAWVAYEQVGAPDDDGDDEDLDALAARLVAETLAELEEEIEPLTDDERAEAIATVRRELEKERS